MRQLDEKLQANNISHILLYTEVKVDYAMLEIPTGLPQWFEHNGSDIHLSQLVWCVLIKLLILGMCQLSNQSR
jgi:hypothetical protein